MDRFGVFVDAGYLLAAGGELCHSTNDRKRLRLDHQSTVAGLVAIARRDCGLEHLRTYWYDGARDARPTAQHIAIAQLPGVKLRLGRLTRSGQKGVDSRIVRDLIILSQERAVSVAYLVGGDEDLREGVREAQERGVRVVLLAVEPLEKKNLSRTLAMEADDVLLLGTDFVCDKIKLAAPFSETATSAAMAPTPTALGRGFGIDWLASVGVERAADVRHAYPRIPPEIDRLLLGQAADRLAKAHLEDRERAAIRAGFWDAVVIARTPE